MRSGGSVNDCKPVQMPFQHLLLCSNEDWYFKYSSFSSGLFSLCAARRSANRLSLDMDFFLRLICRLKVDFPIFHLAATSFIVKKSSLKRPVLPTPALSSVCAAEPICNFCTMIIVENSYIAIYTTKNEIS